MEFMMLFIVWIVVAIIGMAMAESRNRSPAGGFFLCLVLGIVGLAIIALMGEVENKEIDDNDYTYNGPRNEIIRKIKEEDQDD